MRKFAFLCSLFCGVVLCSCVFCSCNRKGTDKQPGADSSAKKTAAEGAASKDSFILMEKVLSDQPNRSRTTLKIIIPPAAKDAGAVLKQALEQTTRQDPEVKAVIIWAYHTREELNGSNYTAGKLEWSADGKDFMGSAPLTPNPLLDLPAK